MHNIKKLTDQQINDNRREIIKLLSSTHRDGIESVINYLTNSNFFYTRSSYNRHHNWLGGLAEHSLGVYHIAKDLAQSIPDESIIIAAILHDICKSTMRYKNEYGKTVYKYADIYGHGRRSIKLLTKVCNLKLTEEERRAIRWHMGGHHAKHHEKDDVKTARQSELWKIVHQADHCDAKNNPPC